MPTVRVDLEIPMTLSPVPYLCSIHATKGRGDFGDSTYRGNCSGLLIRDLLKYYGPKSILDPMEGSGTARDVANAMGIAYQGYDLRNGFDATSPDNFCDIEPVDFVWLHPPYSDLISWTNDERCLSNCQSKDEFYKKLRSVVQNCIRALRPKGHIAILIGDVRKNGHYYGLPFLAWKTATELGLELAAPEIVRLSHGASSTARSYSFSFIPRVHDICFVFRRISNKGASSTHPTN